MCRPGGGDMAMEGVASGANNALGPEEQAAELAFLKVDDLCTTEVVPANAVDVLAELAEGRVFRRDGGGPRKSKWRRAQGFESRRSCARRVQPWAAVYRSQRSNFGSGGQKSFGQQNPRPSYLQKPLGVGAIDFLFVGRRHANLLYDVDALLLERL